MAEEIFKNLLSELVQQNSSIAEENKRALISEINKMDVSSQVFRDVLKSTLGAENVDSAWKSAQARAATSTSLDNPNERHLPKALCLGGDVALLAGVDLEKEKKLLAAILRRAKKNHRAGPVLVSVLEISQLFPSLTPPAAEAVCCAATAVIARIIYSASRLKADRLRQESSNPGDSVVSTISSHPGLSLNQGNLRLLRLADFLNSSKSEGGSLLTPWLLERFETRMLASAQARILTLS